MIRIIRCWCLCLLTLAVGSRALGQLVGGESQREVVITLDSGEILKGPLIEQTPELYRLDHVILGKITIPAVRVVSVDEIRPGVAGEPSSVPSRPQENPPTDQAPAEAPVVNPPAQPAKPAPATAEKKPGQKVKPKPGPVWSGSLEVGVNGSIGNTDLQRARVVIDTKRKTERETLDLRLQYQATKTNGKTSENRLFVRAKNDWATSKARWRVFVEGSAEHDQFRDFDWRMTGNSGLAYDAIKNDKTSLTFRGGLGGSIELGSDQDGLAPEGILGFDLRHKFSRDVSLTSRGELIPDLQDPGEYRTRINASMDTNLDKAGAWKLRVGIEDRYESNTTRAKKNDFDYFVSVVHRF